MSECATCHGSGSTPCGMSFTGPNDRPARIQYGPCPVCRDGRICPSCFYEGGMDEDDLGKPKCRFCGWSAFRDRTTLEELKDPTADR